MTIFKERLFGKTGIEITATNENDLTGSIILTKKNNSCHIGYIGVKNIYRGQGISTELLDKAEKWAVEQGLSEICGNLIPIPGSEVAIISLMKKNNYEILEKGKVKKII